MAQAVKKTKAITEFGDFQTPDSLALQVTEKLRLMGVQPKSILEPTCGRGAFVWAAAESFPEAEVILGVEINRHHTDHAMSLPRSHKNIRFQLGDFFATDWTTIFAQGCSPWLILGNPPWVTNSSLGSLQSGNVPDKKNSQERTGIEAVTGKSNFDISEWMLLRYLDWLQGTGTIAVLCKTSVARKFLAHAWKQSGVSFSRIYKIDAMVQFGAAVDACLLVVGLDRQSNNTTCDVFDSIEASSPASAISCFRGHLVNDTPHHQLEGLWGSEIHYTWRSGIKHDCSRVMELFLDGDGYRNGLGEQVAVEETFLFPMLKGSDIGNGRIQPRAKMVVTQETVGQQTSGIAIAAPDTWRYLVRHQALLNQRGSVIYRKNPDFSVFGVGPYTFAPWKVAISGFYKKLSFVVVGPYQGRPVVFDDTVYFLPCATQREARFLEEILHSELAVQFLSSMIYWPDKRPLTVDLLKRISIEKLAIALGRGAEYEEFTKPSDVQEQQGVFSFAS